MDREPFMNRQGARRWAVLLLALLLVMAMAAPLAMASPAAQTTNVVRVGYLGVRGSDTANGAQLAIDQINSIGGVTAPDGTAYQMELVTLNSEPTVDSLGSAIDELAGQNVTVLLGPDSNALITPDNLAALADSGRPVLTGATGDALTDYDQTNLIFRTRAPERVLSSAAATYLTTDLALTTIAAVQTEVEFTEALMHFENTLTTGGLTLAAKIQLPGGDALIGETQGLINLNPQAIVMWGTYQDAELLLRVLRDAGWSGIFVYRRADEAARADVMPDALAAGVYGMDSWSYGDPLEASQVFLRDYVVAFGEVPGPLAAAAYDVMWYLRFAVAERGADPASLQAGLIGGTPRTLVQGVYHPIEFGNGDLARIGVIYRLGPLGGAEVVARFDDTTRLEINQPGVTPEETAVPGETPVPTVDPNVTVVPTATLEGVWVRVNVQALNVRTGPGPNYDRLGQVELNAQFRVLGAIADYSWFAIDFQSNVGWVAAQYVEVLGGLAGVSIVQPPPTPTISATLTPSLPPNPDIVIDTVSLSPPQPLPNRAFTAAVTVRNAGGGAAGRFAVAATWEPGGVYTASFVEGLAGGQTAQVFLTPTLGGTGVFQVAIVADLNNDVPELNEGNNTYNVTYRVDYPLFANQSNIQLVATTDHDLYGGTTDIRWDGFNIGMLNGSKIGVLSGVTFDNVHYDLLSPGVITNTVGLGTDQVLTGAIFGLYTAEGKRAVIRVDNRTDTTIWISYKVYNDTP